MPFFPYNASAQGKFAPSGGEPFLKNVPQNKLFLPKEGRYQIRVMPPWSQQGLFAKFVKLHWGVGLSQAIIVCPDMFGQSCPFCETWLKLRTEYDKFKPDVDACRPARRYYSNVVNLATPQLGVLAYSYGKTVYKLLKDLQDSGAYGDITDPVNGCDIHLTRSGTGRQVQDTIYPNRDATPLQDPSWLDAMFNLDDILIQPDQGDVEAAFNSQPWKVYTPTGKVAPAAPVPAAQPYTPSQPVVAEQPALVVQAPVSPVAEQPAPAPTPVAVVQPPIAAAPTETPDQKMERIKKLEEQIRAKLNPGAAK